MLRTARKTLKRVVILLLLIAAVLGGIGTYYWAESTRILREEFVAYLRAWAPEARFSVGKCTFDWLGRVHVDGFSVELPDEPGPLLDLPDIVVDVNRDALIQRQRVEVEAVRIIRPSLDLVRHADGTWNWQKLPPLPQTDGRSSLPGCVLEQAQLRLQIAQPDGLSSGTVVLENATLQLTPNGKRSFLIKGRGRIDRVGYLTIDGRLNVDTQTGSLNGRLSGVRVGRDLLALVSSFEPRASQTVAKIETQLREEMQKEPTWQPGKAFSIAGLALHQRNQGVFQPAVSTNSPVEIRTAVGSNGSVRGHRIPVDWIGAENSILGVLADLDIDFQIKHLDPAADPSVKLLATLTGGEITNTALPFPLSGLRGQIEYGADTVMLRQISAKNGPTTVFVNGQVTQAQDLIEGNLDLSVENLICDERLRSRLAPAFRRNYDMHNPRGMIDVSASVASQPDGKWKARDLLTTAKKCSIMHEKFPYPLRDLVGSIRQEGQDFKINLLGYAGHRPVTLRGSIVNPGPEAHIVVDAEVQDLALDRQFLDACNPQTQKVITSMALTGTFSGTCRFERPPGLGQKMKTGIRASLRNGTMAYRTFPYRVDQLTGELSFDGLDWKFWDLKGTHGPAKLSAHGSYTRSQGPQLLQLEVTTLDAPIDQSLYLALPDNLKELWEKFSPSGTIKKSKTNVSWTPGQSPAISLPEVVVTDGSLLAQAFPYELKGINATYKYSPWQGKQPARLTIQSFSSRHDRTQITGDGYVEIHANGVWRFHLDQYDAKNLLPDRSLTRACPAGLREALSAFDPDEPLNLSGEVELLGTSDPRVPITAGWWTELKLSGNTVSIGIDLNDVYGNVKTQGSWNGSSVELVGMMDLSTISIHDTRRFKIHDIRGPFRLGRNSEGRDILTVGSDKVLSRVPQKPPEKKEQITARFLSGEVAFNAAVDLTERPEYELRVDLGGARLERFAQLYMRSRDRLRGTVNGWIELRGNSSSSKSMTGRGQVQISPAELYELPVVVQVLTRLHKLDQVSDDDAAFNYALAKFNIRDERFEFGGIDLVGPQLQLRGRGIATFDGRLGLRFASIFQGSRSLLRQRGVWIPVLTEAAGFLSGVTGIVGVQVDVTGTTSNPETRVIPGGNIDNALKALFQPLPTTLQGLAQPPVRTRIR